MRLTSPPNPLSASSEGEKKREVTGDAIPRWLWRGAWIALGSVMVIGAMGVALLAGGLADPPRAGPLVWSIGPQTDLGVPPHYSIAASRPLRLSPVPYTLEVTAQFSQDGDPAAAWEIVWDKPAAPFRVRLDSQGFISVAPSQPDSMPFIHVRPIGQPNRITLNVDATGQGVVRINDEIAWRGAVPAADSAYVQVTGGKTLVSHFVIQQIALYATLSHS